jgi:general secretion pathway protein K
MSEFLIIAGERLSKKRLGKRGMALLLTLLVTIILAIVVLEFNYLIGVKAMLSSRIVDDIRAQAAADAGMQWAIALLLNDALADAEEAGGAFDAYDEEWAQEIELETDRSLTNIFVLDEMAKLNINRLITQATLEYQNDVGGKNEKMVQTFQRLFESFDLEPGLTDKIVDWLDENDEEEPFGAESSYYEGLERPIQCKNGPMDSVEELLLIEGFDKETLYGTEDTPGLVEFVTVCGDEKGRVNINTASEEVIAAVLNSQSQAAMIVDMRAGDPFESAEDMTTRLPDLRLSEKFMTGSSFFSVSARSSFFAGSPGTEEEPIRQVELLALFKRVVPKGEGEDENFRIDTVSWKTNRFLESE